MPQDREAKWHVDAISWLKGGIIGTPEMALKFAELVLEHTQSRATLERQRPLKVEDHGDTWRIEGSWNTDGREAFGGPWRIVVKKHDAQILDIGAPAVVSLPSEVKQCVEEAKRIKADHERRGQR